MRRIIDTLHQLPEPPPCMAAPSAFRAPAVTAVVIAISVKTMGRRRSNRKRCRATREMSTSKQTRTEHRKENVTGIALGTIASASAAPYGSTVSLWSSSAIVMHFHRAPSVGDNLLFAAGALAGSVVVGLSVHGRLRESEPLGSEADRMIARAIHVCRRGRCGCGGAAGADLKLDRLAGELICRDQSHPIAASQQLAVVARRARRDCAFAARAVPSRACRITPAALSEWTSASIPGSSSAALLQHHESPNVFLELRSPGECRRHFGVARFAGLSRAGKTYSSASRRFRALIACDGDGRPLEPDHGAAIRCCAGVKHTECPTKPAGGLRSATHISRPRAPICRGSPPRRSSPPSTRRRAPIMHTSAGLAL